MTKLTANKLDEIRSRIQKDKGDWIKVGLSTCGISAGADEVFEVLIAEKDKRGLDIKIERCGCAGMCHAEPLVEVAVQGLPSVVYGWVDKVVAVEIMDKHVVGKKLLNNHIFNAKVK